jgi:CBS domain-containing protein
MATIEKHVTRDIVALDGGAPCREAARMMARQNIGSIAVREGARIAGIVTERDLVTGVVAGDADVEKPIRQAMRSDLPAVHPSTSEAECIALMRDHRTRHLLVADGARVVGIISMRDLIRLMLDEKEWLIGQLQTFIDGRDGPRTSPMSI